MVCHYEILCIMWQLHFSSFLENVFPITLEIYCLLLRSNYVPKYYTITWRVTPLFLDNFFVVIGTTYWYNVTLIYRFHFLLWRIFMHHNYVVYLFNELRFWWRQNYFESWKLLERVNCVWKLCYKMVIF